MPVHVADVRGNRQELSRAIDSARMRRWGVQTYGILPFPMEQEDEERMHGNDERIPLESLVFGARLIHDAMLRVAAPNGFSPP